MNNINISNNNTATNNDDNALGVIEQLQTMRVADTNVSICANCGKEGAKNICNKCKQVKYCNAVCKKVHKKKHKKDCEEHIRLAAELHEEELFKQPPPAEKDCPICFVRLPTLDNGSKYMTCCGKVICSGCDYAPLYDDQGNEVDNEKCPFCRTPVHDSDEELLERVQNRMEKDDPIALYNIGCYHRDGSYGFPQDYHKALEHFHQAGELSYANAYCDIGIAYENGEGVKVNKKKANYYYELAAIRGNVSARYNLGIEEENEGNMDRALKHYMIAVGAGDSDSVNSIKRMYTNGQATKEDYMKALQLYQEYLGEIKSTQRDEAAAADEDYQYY